MHESNHQSPRESILDAGLLHSCPPKLYRAPRQPPKAGTRPTLRRDYEEVVRLTGWASPKARAWIEEHSLVTELLVAIEDIRMKS